MLNKANVERLKLVEKYEKAIDRLTKIIEKNQREIRSKDDLLVKYQLSQEYLAKLIQEQTIDIDDYQDKIRALGIQITSYEKKFN
jgi:chromosome segregation ATPase